MTRKKFLKILAVIFFTPFFKACINFSKKKNIPIQLKGANSELGHRLRDQKFPEPQSTLHTKALIVGGGIGGLSTAYHFEQNKFYDYLLIELEDKSGGNSRAGKNNVSAYPLGAHYLPLPNNENVPLLQFLEKNEVILGYNETNKPIYNPLYLCHDPEERLHLKGVWQNGLPPEHGLSNYEIFELQKFHNYTQKLKYEKGNDNKYLFNIPTSNSSKDLNYDYLDKISIYDFLKKEGYTSEFLYWYVDYCCKDDFGTPASKTSAWAGLHYFCSRRAQAANAETDEVLTWPQGNHFLVEKLLQGIANPISTNSVVFNIEQKNNTWSCFIYDAKKNTSYTVVCEQLILATPQFINKHLIKLNTATNKVQFNYYPWIVANITIIDAYKLNGKSPLSWDNVIYNSKSLGYVNATNQNLNKSNQTVISLYFNFSKLSAKEERMRLFECNEEDLKRIVLEELTRAHQGIEEIIENIEVYIHGHGMVSPDVGFRTNPLRVFIQNPTIPNLHFTNTDVSGISIFEEGFELGYIAAKKIVNT